MTSGVPESPNRRQKAQTLIIIALFLKVTSLLGCSRCEAHCLILDHLVLTLVCLVPLLKLDAMPLLSLES